MTERKFFGNKSAEEIVEIIQKFHGWQAPGVIIGVIMVDYALSMLPEEAEKDAIVETSHCLPDSIQLFTPCTTGNGWMKVVDWDRFALTIYDKKTLAGFRVWLDPEKLKQYTDVNNWYMRLVPKKSLPLEVLNKAIFAADRGMLSGRAVTVTDLYGKKHKNNISICSGCGEPYVSTTGAVCRQCSGSGYFEYSSSDKE
jgi:formylmethanofuran dehydrogenase subunit E